ncbi:pimeloyl-ACP methyl ester carboxylesterase [Novosphingobium hassiacum]|uniref:Pimeloyl-ACP methyl ester carboxylesterase n=1 Tax=Novosphingobium hassiacum TaxID=173676 RepID=A0A7W5ZYT8_9SPHN|nr:alpha/beta hydrolase [Novosphingobium hassiacum]MBB3860190.1 pimeloyl-ACP methyl ester carboxylesterase [Novosphingobium hassiacum]
MTAIRTIATPVLDVAYEEHGSVGGIPVVLLHGFPYSPRAFDAVAPILAGRGFRVIVPYLRGFGPTRFRSDAATRSGEQAALGTDLIDLVTALGLDRPLVTGYDWGGRAACVAAAIRPDLFRGLVTCGGYNLFGPPVTHPLSPEMEHVLWYQYYLHTERGRAMLDTNRRGFCRLLWKLWSPQWAFDDETFARSAEALDNPDFVEVVLHSYRHRAGLVAGDPALRDLAERLEREQPSITVPTVALYGAAGLLPAAIATQRERFPGEWQYRSLAGVGHNVPQEAPSAFADAVLTLTACGN